MSTTVITVNGLNFRRTRDVGNPNHANNGQFSSGGGGGGGKKSTKKEEPEKHEQPTRSLGAKGSGVKPSTNIHPESWLKARKESSAGQHANRLEALAEKHKSNGRASNHFDMARGHREMEFSTGHAGNEALSKAHAKEAERHEALGHKYKPKKKNQD